MQNRNMPSKPCKIHTAARMQQGAEPLSVYGLTKLEYASIAAMQGILAKELTETNEACAEYAVAQANALFDKLEQDQ